MNLRSSKKTLINKVAELEYLLAEKPTKKERNYMQCLNMVLTHCDNWTIGKKKVNTVETYCELADVFHKNAIGRI